MFTNCLLRATRALNHNSRVFHWKLQLLYRCTKSMALAPFWLSTEHRWTALMPLWFSSPMKWALFTVWKHSKLIWAFLVINGTSLNSINALMVLRQWNELCLLSESLHIYFLIDWQTRSCEWHPPKKFMTPNSHPQNEYFHTFSREVQVNLPWRLANLHIRLGRKMILPAEQLLHSGLWNVNAKKYDYMMPQSQTHLALL